MNEDGKNTFQLKGILKNSSGILEHSEEFSIFINLQYSYLSKKMSTMQSTFTKHLNIILLTIIRCNKMPPFGVSS